MRWNYVLLAVCIPFVAGYGAAWFVYGSSAPHEGGTAIREVSSAYPHIKRLLACDVSDNKDFAEYAPLKRSINEIIASASAEGSVKEVSVYYRDLDSGRWMGITQDELYAPASLYKITLLIAYLKKAQIHPELLDTSYVFASSREADTPDYPPMTVGKSYTVRALLERLIVNSDNDAKDMLHDHIDQNLVNDVFSDLGLEAPPLDDKADSMSAKSYSLFFRILYNGTYLSRSQSEFALTLLSKVTFKDGLAGGLPQGVEVAHKFGHRVFDPPQHGVAAELHDCGIVYASSHPYFLCVMTKGTNYNDLAAIIQNISKTVYAAKSE